MTEQPDDDGVVFVDRGGGIEVAFMGIEILGAVRSLPACGWAFCRMGDGSAWHPASTVDVAKAALRRRVREWFDGLHTRLEPGQGERIAARVRL